MATKRILLAEDDENLGNLLQSYLNSKGFLTTLAKTGNAALRHYHEASTNFDFIILDVMMPEKDGFSVAKEIRMTDKHIPLLFLTAKSMKEDKLLGFEVGADDYLTKPFSMEELLARINAISRRITSPESIHEQLLIGILAYEPSKSSLILKAGPKKLTTKENALLLMLVKNKNEVLDRQATLRAIWGDDNYFNGRSMDVYIAKLRKLLSEDPSIEILNIHGIGFKLIVK
ncbi:MAG: DNA-binding response regulator [Flavobacteriia bacterium]|nr:DNA-binding response regulator [Flavobacteriia bacterium]NBV68842.1 DNA-binding response regulator [Flavobacteriia bacterium]NBV92239.1 DNA-binding response regulator [Flavobacteriia bacterium]